MCLIISRVLFVKNVTLYYFYMYAYLQYRFFIKQKKTGVIQGTTERTDTDRKRERRKKKIHQRLKEKKKLQKLESQKEIPSSKATKLEKLDALKKIKQHKNTKIATVSICHLSIHLNL